MNKLLHVMKIIVIGALLTSCSGGASGLWGAQTTPTPPIQVSRPPLRTVVPGLSPSATLTPLKVLPLPGTPTLGIAVKRSEFTVLPVSTPFPEDSSAPPAIAATLPPINTGGPMDRYVSQGGDTLNILAKRFAVETDKIIAEVVLPPPNGFIPPGTLLLMPRRLRKRHAAHLNTSFLTVKSSLARPASASIQKNMSTARVGFFPAIKNMC